MIYIKAMAERRSVALFLAAATVAQMLTSVNALRELLGDGVCTSTFCKLDGENKSPMH